MKQDYSVKDILNAVDNILKIKSNEDTKTKNIGEIPVKDILTAVDDILKIKPIEESTKKSVNKTFIKNNNFKKIINNPEVKKVMERKKNYDLLVVDNAKDILILNRIIFK